MICPVCGNHSPDSMSECQFCSTPFTPSAPTAPQYNNGVSQYNITGQQYHAPQQQYGTQAQYGAVQPQFRAPQAPYAPAQRTSAQPQYCMMQQSYNAVSQQPYGAVQPTYSTGQQQYGTPASPYTAAPPVYGTAADANSVQNSTSEEESAETTVHISDEEDTENEKNISKGTLAALLVWFAFIAIAFAAIYFNVPEMVSGLIDSASSEVSASDEEQPETSDNTSNDKPTNSQPVMDALYGTWVMCTYYVQDLSDSSVTGGQHYTHTIPLQFYTFNSGRLDRCSGSTAAFLSHEEVSYTYLNGSYTGPLIAGGSSAPSVVLDESYMCIYDTYEINGTMCYVEYALLRVFDEPATNEAITVYAEAIENGTVSLPQYTSSIMTNPSMATSAPTVATSQISATYGMLGTWLLTERVHTRYDSTGQPIGDAVTSSVADGSLTYNYVVFRLDNTYVLYTLKFTEDMSECLEKSSENGTYEFSDGLLAFAPTSAKTSVTAGGGMMYFEYDVNGDGVTDHYRDTYISISSDEYDYDQLLELRPNVQ